MSPPRELRPDEVWCARCEQYFVDGYAYDKHDRNGKCIDPASLDMVRDSRRAWGYPVGRDGKAVRRKRSRAEVAFERLLDALAGELPPRKRARLLEQLAGDTETIRRELRRAKEDRQ